MGGVVFVLCLLTAVVAGAWLQLRHEQRRSGGVGWLPSTRPHLLARCCSSPPAHTHTPLCDMFACLPMYTTTRQTTPLQILLQDNKAGTARPSDIAGGLLPDDCQKKQQPAPKRPLRRGARGGSVATPGASIAGISSDASSSSSSSLSPIWRMSHFLGELHRASILNNTGSIALDISGMALAAPLTELLVAGNMASGIRLLLPEPKYDNQSIELYDVFVEHNSLSPAAPLVSA